MTMDETNPAASALPLPGALDGVRIADFTRVLAGPYATMLLADLGADVVKVERPGSGDDTRAWSPPTGPDGVSTYFESVNRNKRSVRIDLGSESGLADARELIGRSDVVVHNFAPGTMERFGLDYPALRASRPDLVYSEISGFGDGPGASMPGYDLLVQAVGGLMSITGPGPADPTKVGVAVVDVICGLHAAIGMLAALRHRAQTGHGQLVQVNLLSSLLSALVNQSQAYVAAGVNPVAMGNAHPSISPYETYRTADREVVIAVGTDRQFASLCTVLGIPQVADDPRFAANPSRVVNRAELNAALSAVLAPWDSSALLAALASARVPAGPVNSIGEAVALAESLGLEPVVEVAGPEASSPAVPVVRNPIRLSATPAQYRLPPPGPTPESLR